MKRYAKFGYAAPFRFRIILEKPQGAKMTPLPTRVKVIATGRITKHKWNTQASKWGWQWQKRDKRNNQQKAGAENSSELCSAYAASNIPHIRTAHACLLCSSCAASFQLTPRRPDSRICSADSAHCAGPTLWLASWRYSTWPRGRPDKG